jgi:hypothetical protein
MKKEMVEIDNINYLRITELPSQFRFYDKKEIFVRELNLLEADALGKYIDEKLDYKGQLKDLVRIYKDVIKGIDIYDLELLDFLALIMISSTLTQENFNGGITDIKCVNLVDNPKKSELIKKIEELKKKLVELSEKEEIDKLQEEIINLELEYASLPDKAPCGTNINQPITIFDFEFEDDIYKEEEIINIKGKDYKLSALRVKDYIEIEDYKNKEDKIKVNNEKIYFIAAYIKDLDNLEDKIKLLVSSPLNVFQKIVEYDNKLYIEQKPIKKKCPKCGYINNIIIGLDSIKVYP